MLMVGKASTTDAAPAMRPVGRCRRRRRRAPERAHPQVRERRAHAPPSWPPSDAAPQRFEVEVALDAVQHLVADDPVVPHPDDRLALGVEDGCADLEVVEPLLLVLVAWPVAVRPDV